MRKIAILVMLMCLWSFGAWGDCPNSEPMCPNIHAEIKNTISNEQTSNDGAFSAVVGTPSATTENNSHHSGFVAISENSEGNSLAPIVGIAERSGLALTAPTCDATCATNNILTVSHAYANGDEVYITATNYTNVVAYTIYTVCEVTGTASFGLTDHADGGGADCDAGSGDQIDLVADAAVSATFYRASNSGTNYGIQGTYINYFGTIDRLGSGVKGEVNQAETGATIVQLSGVTGLVTSSAAGTLTDGMALRALDCSVGAGTITNCSGLYVDAQTAGTNNYDIFLNGTEDSAIDSSIKYALGATQIPSLQAIYSQLSTTEDLLLGWLSPDPSTGTEFDFSGGTNAFTYSGFAATADGNTMWGGRTLTFDGTDDKLTRADDADFELLSNDWTIWGWIKPTAGSSSSNVIIAKMETDYTKYEWQIWLDSSERLTFTAVDDTDDEYCAFRVGTDTLAGTWYHFAIVHTGDGGTDYCSAEITTYINGSSVAMADAGSALTGGFTLTGTAASIGIGFADDPDVAGTTIEWYQGDMGEIVVDNGKASSAAEVLYLYNTTSSLYGK